MEGLNQPKSTFWSRFTLAFFAAGCVGGLDSSKQAISHNWLLLEMGADAKAFNQASLQAKDNNYVLPDMEGQVISETGLVANGKTKPASFTVPEETGDYDYLCTFPGHFATMRGTFTVE